MFDYFREPKTPEEKKHREEMEAARLRRIQILKERSDEQLVQEAIKRDGEMLRKEREERSAPKDVELTNPRWYHIDETARAERPDFVYVGDKICLLVDQEHGSGKVLDFNIHDNKISSKVDPSREVDAVKARAEEKTVSAEWTVLEPRSQKEKDREMQVYFYVRSGKDYSENCDIKIVDRPFTIADAVEILKAIESEEGFPAARFFASHLNYEVLCEMAKSANKNSDNDPNLMPTRFMLIPGADDAKLLEINDHPDKFENGEEHKVNVINLQKGLNLLGEEVPEDGVFGEETEEAFLKFLNSSSDKSPIEKDTLYTTKDGDTLGSIAAEHGIVSWKYLYELNKELIGDNPDLMTKDLELTIPGFEATSGDEKIEEKGYPSKDYLGGLPFTYTWVPFSMSLFEEEESAIELEEELNYDIIDVYSELIIYSGVLTDYSDINILLPNSKHIDVQIDGLTFIKG